jgi:hypothetical protein
MNIPLITHRPRLLFLLPRYVRTTFLLSILIGLVMALIISVLFFRLQPEVPLFYSLAQDSQHLVAKEWLFLFPGLSLIITLLHMTLFTSAHDMETLLLKLFAWTTVGVQSILFAALLRIIIIIT